MWLSSALAFAIALGCYLLLAGSTTWTEVAAGCVVAAAVAAFATLQRLRQERPLALRLPPGRVLRQAATGLVTDSFRVGAALARALVQQEGGTRSWQAFRPGGAAPADSGRRALVTLLTSLAPNGFVLDIRPSAQAEADHGLLLHRLAPAAPLSGKDWPS